MADDPRIIVSTDWLEAHLKDPDLRVLDMSLSLIHISEPTRPY